MPQPLIRSARLGATFTALSILQACTGVGTQLGHTLHLVSHGSTPTVAPTRTDLTYLRSTMSNGSIAYLVLGYEESSAQGELQTWYSSQGEVIQLLNGRIQNTAGLPIDWKSVRMPTVPDWNEVSEGARFVRTRDLMPNYQFGIVDTVSLHDVSSNDVNWTWWEERLEQTTGPTTLPPARYGLRRHDGRWQVHFTHQCLTESVCLKLERWTPSTP